MKTLVIHPADRSTDFLIPIYGPIIDKMVITGGVTKQELRKHIADADQILMMGHGDPNGLYSVNQFDDDFYIIDGSMADVLMGKTNSIFIWCYADEFVKTHQLNGFASGMFISERAEAVVFGYGYVGDNVLEESNWKFAEIVSKYIDAPLDVLYQAVLLEYGDLAKTNPIASFNFKRIRLSQTENVWFPEQGVQIL